MARFRLPLLCLLICLPVAYLATGSSIPGLDGSNLPQPLPVPEGDQEIAWLHTTTNGTTWERFVSGVARAQMLVPGLHVDDSAAFVDQSSNVPELVLSMDGRAGRLRIRWYKLTAEATASYWVSAFAMRSQPPLAMVGGGSSDRAFDLARALARQTNWHGDRPLLLITTATADEVVGADETRPNVGLNLIDVYDDRSFRFCFSNRQMAEAVLDFVWATPGLRPERFADTAIAAVASGLIVPNRPPLRPQVFSGSWQDDPFSTDLHAQFRQSLDHLLNSVSEHDSPANFSSWNIPYSVGGFNRPNPHEAKVVEEMLKKFSTLEPQRSILILPTITQPARRLVRTLVDAHPLIGKQLTAIMGDGIPVNAVYRDGEFAWPAHSMSVPLVLFTHHNPVAWDDATTTPRPPPGYELLPPNSTEDVLHFAEMTKVMVEACYAPPGAKTPLVSRADTLADHLRQQCPTVFDGNGNRRGGTGEYVVVITPEQLLSTDRLSARPRIVLEVWRRDEDRTWKAIRTLTLDQWNVRGLPSGDRRD